MGREAEGSVKLFTMGLFSRKQEGKMTDSLPHLVVGEQEKCRGEGKILNRFLKHFLSD